ncbi:MAG: translation initiation factor IF-2 [Endomicrobiaceae bacterium]|jgi:translation initiation factor IF-2|nr:translation initiation factor IF-2 [Endomicrobiaceae bacterium]MDD3730220.1 translation initiation factor IF-2 [Endomicrobiaceae bacterium]MDD4166421.1 translation initiation factor IF-2 [Endomicrobiaceae bacterium]
MTTTIKKETHKKSAPADAKNTNKDKKIKKISSGIKTAKTPKSENKKETAKKTTASVRKSSGEKTASVRSKIKKDIKTADLSSAKTAKKKVKDTKQADIERIKKEAEIKQKEEARRREEERIKKEKEEAERKRKEEELRLQEEKARKEKEEAERKKKEELLRAQEKENSKNTININELITVKDLAEKMKLKVGDVLKKLLLMGSFATINQRLDTDTAILLANEFGFDAKFVSIDSEVKIETEHEADDVKNLLPRSPIVTIMGHVDHGKTSLLDALRKSNVVAGEAGGITQHIGAYRVKTSGGEITFLDTPGHEAFTAMRSRGAHVTDIVILVVSATDGVMPQTIEAINHAKAAGVPIIAAVNKIDLPTAEPEKIRQELSNYGLLPEEWGGDTIMVDISAKQKLNIENLLEMVQLKAEMMELKANPNKKAEGIVVEAKLDPKKGTLATLLVQNGTLKVGDNIVVGTTYGKVRAMIDEYGKRFDAALPSMPVEILGINEPPQAGDKFIVLEHESQAREIANSRKEKVKADSLRPKHHVSLIDISAGKTKELKIILKTDVQGSLGALCDALERMSNSEITLKIIHKGAGAITESDVVLAAASDAMIVGFNIRPDAAVEKLSETEGVSINVYRIIYELIADIKAAMEGLLDPDTKERIIGKAVVKQVFKLSSAGTISGCMIIEGKAQRGVKVRLLRDNVIVFEGSTSSIKRFKEDVKEVDKGYECGIGLENFSDLKTSDIIEFFTIEKTARKLIED